MLRKALLVILLLTPPLATAVVMKLNAYPRRFAAVEPYSIYRGGRPTPGQIERLHSEFNIKTIVSLLEDKKTPADAARVRTANQSGIKITRIPMPGDGTADFALLDMAADAIARPENQPLFFHCAAGKQRSNAVTAAYRMKHCGWTLEQALSELQEKHGLEREDKERRLVEHLKRYANWLKSSKGADATAAGPIKLTP
ncbi:MAG: dual specificity protein phosphatase family protein [Planctomycetes bacterium]|nr:dual specificity protein phosphatase family protein [Planctomycetota bacterium]